VNPAEVAFTKDPNEIDRHLKLTYASEVKGGKKIYRVFPPEGQAAS
jgi:hypothetical protein